jgi:hypothetical protein
MPCRPNGVALPADLANPLSGQGGAVPGMVSDGPRGRQTRGCSGSTELHHCGGRARASNQSVTRPLLKRRPSMLIFISAGPWPSLVMSRPGSVKRAKGNTVVV